MKFHITPHTKIIDILNTYPEVEDFLIELVPTFIKLKNPILRNTIGKIATIEQAAKVGNISMPFLINSLNEKLGLIPEEILQTKSIESSDWDLADYIVTQTINADELINNGEKPVAVVLGALSKLKQKEILELDCSFHPAPLIDKAKERGFEAKEIRNEDLTFSIYFRMKT